MGAWKKAIFLLPIYFYIDKVFNCRVQEKTYEAHFYVKTPIDSSFQSESKNVTNILEEKRKKNQMKNSTNIF